MSNINRDYLIKVDVKTSKVEAPTMHFYNTDVGTSNIYVQLTIKETLLSVNPIENATDYSMQVSIIKPNNVVKVLNGELVNKDRAIFEFNLPDNCTNVSGIYQLEFDINCVVSEHTEKITTFPASYEVKKSILTDFVPELTDTEDNTMMRDILTQLEGKFDDVRVNEEETGSTQVSLDFYSNGTKVKNLVFAGGGGGGGGGGDAPYISTTLPENIMLATGESLEFPLEFYSSNPGQGTLKVFINDKDTGSTKISQGATTVTIASSKFTKGNNQMVIYVLDRYGKMSNSLTFYVRYGGTELTSDFDPYQAYDKGAVVRYYFTASALDTSKPLTFYMRIDGQLQSPVSCTSDVRGYFTFPTSLSVGRHYCEAWVDDGTSQSNTLTFSLVILDEASIVVASDTVSATVEEGAQLVLDYKVYMKNNSSFITKTYVNNSLVNTGTCGLETNYFRTSSLIEGQHTVKVEVYDVTQTVSDSITWNITVTASQYEMLKPVTTGSLFIGTAVNKSNADQNKEVWVGKDQDNADVTATLTNFTFNSENGWVDDKLIISGKSWVEVPVNPLANNARYGMTIDIEFLTKPIGVDDAEVLNLWNDTDNCGIKITTDRLIMRSKAGNECNLFFSENEVVSATFVIDRNEKVAKVYINGVMCEGFPLSDYVANGVSYLEDFTVNSNIFLGGYDKNGYCEIRNFRVYEIALATDEILNNTFSNITDKAKQKAKVQFQKGETLPTLTVYCDFSGLGKNDAKPCKITYMSPDVELYGESFALQEKNSTIQYQGTSSMAYPIKNYKIKLKKDGDGKKFKYNPFSSGQPESTFTLKADFMSSGHWQNTGLAKWISDNLYQYNTSNEKSMNPMKWHSIQNGGNLNDTRETINGFPCRLILINDGETPLNEGQNEPTPGNVKDMGIFNFNNDKGNTDTFGLDNEIFPRCVSYEVVANSDTSAGAFVPYSGSDSQEELAYLQDSFELRYPDDKEVGADYGMLGMDIDNSGTLNSEYGLKRVIDWVGNATNEEFVANFEQYFNKEYTFRYYLLVITLGMVDNLGKNMMLDTWDGKIWYPRFYDMDTICSYNNSGQIKYDVDIEMAQGYWNTSASRLWTKIRDNFHDELVAMYAKMRANGLSYDSLMSYFYGQQISKIPETYYNKDADTKYLPFATQYMGMAHGNGYEHLKRWLKNRLIFTDTLYDYAPSYNNDVLTIRANTTEPMTITIETYTPVYQHLSWYNNQMDKKKIDGKIAVTFTGTAQTATDQEVLIYGGSNIKRITGISSMNPNSMLIGSATRLIELDVSNCPILATVNATGSNFTPHTYLNKLDISNCPNLTGTLRVNNSPLLRELNASGTGIDTIQLPPSVRNLEVLRLPNTVTELTLNDAGLLNTLIFDEGGNLQRISLSNCPGIANSSIDLTKVPTVSLDNSLDKEEIYLSEVTDLTLKNMPTLKRLLFTPNNEYEEFDINNVINGKNYKVTTFNNPNMKEFITTAPHRLSYHNGEYGNITPNTVFSANTLDLSDTQFTDIKFLCTTDLYNLKVPTTMKNFYCDSAMDIDTEVITEASYEVIHDELIEQYTTNYEDEIKITDAQELSNVPLSDLGFRLGWLNYDQSTYSVLFKTEGDSSVLYEPLEVVGGTKLKITGNIHRLVTYDKDLNKLSVINGEGGIDTTLSNDVKYIAINMFNGNMSSATIVNLTTIRPQVPNIIPSSASGSLIFNLYSNNTTQPTSTSPYMWDLTGLKLNDFYTFGMNNWVKGDFPIKELKNNTTIYRVLDVRYNGSSLYGYGTTYKNGCIISPILLDDDITSIKITTSNGLSMLHHYSTDFNGTTATTQGFSGGNTSSGATLKVSSESRLRLITFLDTDLEWFDMTLVGNETKTIRYYMEDMVIVSVKDERRKTWSTVSYDTFYEQIPTSITMPQRLPGYSIRMVNADITPNNYANHLYPLLVDTTLPITGKLDYSKYKGTSLAWAYAYTTNDVAITPLDSQHIGGITNEYNKLYGTDFVDIVDVWAYKDDDFSNKSTNEAITKAYIELTSSNYKTRIDEVLQWYPNCTDVYLFEDGSVTGLGTMFHGNNNNNNKNQIVKVKFIEGYFSGVTSMYATFYNCKSLTTVPNIPNSVTNMNNAFEGCSALTTAPTIPDSVTNMTSTFQGCSALTTVPNIPNSVTNMDSTFRNCTSLTTVPNIPNGVTSMTNTFYGCSSLTTVPNIPDSITHMTGIFNGCSSLTKCTIPLTNLIKYTGSLTNCSSLTNITWVGERTADFSLATLGAPSYTQADIQELVPEHLGTVESATLTLGATNLAYLTDEEKASAVAKGWTLQ